MVLCLIVNCGNKTGSKKPKSSEGIRFFHVPSVITNQGELIEELTSERRQRWISAISREDLTEKILSNDRCVVNTLSLENPLNNGTSTLLIGYLC